MKKFITLTIAMLMLATPVMAEDGVKVMIDGTEVADRGVIVDGRTLVPVRGIFEQLGFEVDYNADTKTATLTNDDTTVTMTQGESTFKVNDRVVTPDVPQQIINSRFMLPLRAVSNAVGVDIDWDVENKTVTISTSATDNSELKKNPDGSYSVPGVSIEVIESNVDNLPINDIVIN